MSVVSIVLTTLFVTAFVLWIGANLATTEKRLLYRPRRLYTSGDADFRRALGILLGPPLVPGNKVSTLVNGAQIYPAMLNAIRSAHTNITFETFVFRDAIVTVRLNGQLVVENVPLENFWEPGEPLPTHGPIELLHATVAANEGSDEDSGAERQQCHERQRPFNSCAICQHADKRYGEPTHSPGKAHHQG